MITRGENYEKMADIWLEASVRAHDFIDQSFWLDQYAAMRDRYLPSAENFVFIDHDTRKKLGFISLKGNHIAALFVDPFYQGRGIGRALLAYARAIRQNLSLAVFEENKRAVKFYLNNGFEVHDRRVEPTTGHYELVMTTSR